jgi:quinol-cytochrome oxidoreductase complex cytochrome b subunit
VIVGVVILHIWALHIHGSNNPLGIDVKTPQDTIAFHPYYTYKDFFGFGVFFLIFAWFVFFAPNSLGHPDNYIPANPLVTPPHIVPEWYFLPFYAILRAVPDIGIPFTHIVFIESKLAGVIAMFGSILIMFALPWIDRCKVRSGDFRPRFKLLYLVFIVNAIILGYVGAKPAEGGWIILGRVCTTIYFGYFVVLYWMSKNEKTLPLPESISKAVLAKHAPAHH